MFLVSCLSQYLIETYGDQLKGVITAITHRPYQTGDEEVVAGSDDGFDRLGRHDWHAARRPWRPTASWLLRVDPGPPFAGSDWCVVVASIYPRHRADNVWMFVGAMAASRFRSIFASARCGPRIRTSAGDTWPPSSASANMCASFGRPASPGPPACSPTKRDGNMVSALAAISMIVAAGSWLLIDPTHTVESGEPPGSDGAPGDSGDDLT